MFDLIVSLVVSVLAFSSDDTRSNVANVIAELFFFVLSTSYIITLWASARLELGLSEKTLPPPRPNCERLTHHRLENIGGQSLISYLVCDNSKTQF